MRQSYEIQLDERERRVRTDHKNPTKHRVNNNYSVDYRTAPRLIIHSMA